MEKIPNQLTQPNFEIVQPSVKLTGITKPCIEGHPEIQTAEQLIAYHARVSNPSNQANPNIVKLLQYCIDKGHISIFEQADISFEIVTSRDISAQILRHNCKPQEFSQRYAEVTEFLPVEARLQDTKDRQNSLEIDSANIEQVELEVWLQEEYRRVLMVTMQVYKQALEKGIAKEVARKLLPINAKTTICVKWNVRDLMFYIDRRTEPSTQKEHRIIAEMIKVIFIEQFPIISKAKGWC